MNDSAQSGFFSRPGATGNPMLLHCDFLGRVLWTSGGTPASLDTPRHILDLLGPQIIRNRVRISVDVEFWPVLAFPTSVVIGAQIVEDDAGPTRDLQDLQQRISIRFLQLMDFERRLCASVQERQGVGGHRAVRQIELERQRLGRELHTGVGQLLAAIRLQLELIAIELPSPSSKVSDALHNISTLAADTLEEVRGISRRLHPPEWQRLTLESAVRQLWEVSGIPERFEAELEMDSELADPDLDVKILIYRGLQEALSNIVRHSNATRISVELGLCERLLVMTIRDNGIGFDPDQLVSTPASVVSGIGLRGLRETARELGGKLEVESGPNGTKLVVSVAPHPVIS